MSDNIKLVLEQTRDKAEGKKVIFDLTANWYDMADWEANMVNRDIVTGIVKLAEGWDKALTGGPPTA